MDQEPSDAQFTQNFRGADIRSGDGSGSGRGGDIGSYNTVNSNNIVTHNTTIHIHSEEQLSRLSIPLLTVRKSASQGSQASGSGLGPSSQNPSPAVKTLNASRPHFIVNEEGQVLDVSGADGRIVLSWPYNGGQNQQWFLSEDDEGRTAFMCLFTRKYLAFRRLEEDGALSLSALPFYWDVSAHGDKYRIAIPKLPQSLPQANLALSLAYGVVSLRPSHETHNTHLYILAENPENRLQIEALEKASRSGIFITAPPNVVHQEDGKSVDFYGRAQFIFNRQGRALDLSGADYQTVLAWDFHGNTNQQWAFERHSGQANLVAIKSLVVSVYVAYGSLAEDAGLFCTPQVVYWELYKDDDGFKLAIPGSHIGIGFAGDLAKLKPLYADTYTRLHLLENSEANVDGVRRGNFSKIMTMNRGSIPRPITDAPRPSHIQPFTARIDDPCLMIGYTGMALDLAYHDRRVYAFPCHGDTNQQWIIRTNGRGGATIQSRLVDDYVKYHQLQLDSKLVLDPSPFLWEMITDGDGYRFAIPGTTFALSLGACARIRHLHEQPGTCIYLMDTSPQSRAIIQSGTVSTSTVKPKSHAPSTPLAMEASSSNHGVVSQESPPLWQTEQGRTWLRSEGSATADEPANPQTSMRSSFGKKSKRSRREGSSSKDCVLQ